MPVVEFEQGTVFGFQQAEVHHYNRRPAIMCKLILVVGIVALVGVFAEPPSPRQYLPPGQARQQSRPSSQYGAPNGVGARRASSHSSAPSSQYGAPSAQYNAPATQYNAPSAQYSAPASQYSAPSSQYGAPSSQYGAPSGRNGGFNGYANSRSNQDDDLAEPANYEFSYEVQDSESGNDFGHRESRQGDEATGSYHVLLPDGRTQIVDYVANAEGYMPTIRYEGGDDANGPYAASRGGQNGYQY